MNIDYDEINIMIDDCLKRINRLNNWEKEFINSIDISFNNLTSKQIDCINLIWEKATKI